MGERCLGAGARLPTCHREKTSRTPCLSRGDRPPLGRQSTVDLVVEKVNAFAWRVSPVRLPIWRKEGQERCRAGSEQKAWKVMINITLDVPSDVGVHTPRPWIVHVSM